MKRYKAINTDIEFDTFEEAVSALLDDPKQKRIYDMMKKLHKDDMVIWLDGVLECAEVFGIDCDGLNYLHDEMMEVGESVAINAIDSARASIKSAIDPSDKPFYVTIEFPDGTQSDEMIYAFNARTAKMIADSNYKNKPHKIVNIQLASKDELDRYIDTHR